MPPEQPQIAILLRSDGETLGNSEDHGETIDATRCWVQRPLARGRCARALWKGLGARGVLPGRACRRLLLAHRMHASVLLGARGQYGHTLGLLFPASSLTGDPLAS